MKLLSSIEVFESGYKGKTPVIFIHGFPYDHYMWDNQVDFLKDDYHCITYDVRGLGQSEAGDGQYTLELLVDDLSGIIDQLKIDKPVICGLSMGGYIALRAVEREQSKFSGLILCDTKSAADDNSGKLKRAGGIKKINTEGLDAYIDEAVPVTFAKETIENEKEIYEPILNRAKGYNPVGVKGCILAMAGRTDTTESLSKIEIPTLVICGNLDSLTPPFLMREIAGKIKNSEFASAPRAAHMSPVENPDFVNDVIKGFLKRRIS
jgi:pimeloyl-ACP methyl ester carboxylesterase